MSQTASFSKIIHASLLVTGTCVGGGMLALPLWISQNGFIGASLALLLCWLFMVLTAWFLLEANSWFPVGTHFVNTAEGILGRWGKWITWVIYGFIAYASLIAYIAGGGQILEDLFLRWGLPSFLGDFSGLIFAAGCGAILAFGAAILARFNSFFFAAMMLMFVAILLLGTSHLEPRPFQVCQFKNLWQALPLFLAAFSFQMIVPSLRSYLGGDIKAVKQSLIAGLLLTLLIYVVWSAFVFSVVAQEGAYSLKSAFERGEPITRSLLHAIDHPWLSFLVTFFSFFALTTSFLGISLSLYEFLEDSLGWRKDQIELVKSAHVMTNYRKPLLLALVLVPSWIFAASFERIFLIALDLSGGLGDTILNGLIPVAMVLVGTQQLRLRSSGSAKASAMNLGYSSPIALEKLTTVKGTLLALCGLFALSILLLELLRLFKGLM